MDFALCTISWFWGEHQDTFFTTERAAMIKLLKVEYMYENIIYIVFLTDLFLLVEKIMKWEGLQQFTFLRMHVCTFCI